MSDKSEALFTIQKSIYNLEPRNALVVLCQSSPKPKVEGGNTTAVELENIEKYAEFVEGLGPVSRKAFEIAYQIHSKDYRKTGEPFIFHPLEVARILKDEMGITSDQVIAAALVHDTIEDHPEAISVEKMKAELGERVATMVSHLTKEKVKLGEIIQNKNPQPGEAGEAHANQEVVEIRKEFIQRTYANLFSEGHPDNDVLLIKLADRLHNMRTINGFKKKKQAKEAILTLVFYLPICKKLGEEQVGAELEKRAKEVLEKKLDTLNIRTPRFFSDLLDKVSPQ